MLNAYATNTIDVTFNLETKTSHPLQTIEEVFFMPFTYNGNTQEWSPTVSLQPGVVLKGVETQTPIVETLEFEIDGIKYNKINKYISRTVKQQNVVEWVVASMLQPGIGYFKSFNNEFEAVRYFKALIESLKQNDLIIHHKLRNIKK